MTDDLIADIWTVLVEQIPEKSRNGAANEYVNTLLDHDVSEALLRDLLGVDTYLDVAIHYATDLDDEDEDLDDGFED